MLEKHRGSQHLFLKLYAPGVADRPAKAEDGTESSMGDLWMQRWMPEYNEWFNIDNTKAMSAQASGTSYGCSGKASSTFKHCLAMLQRHQSSHIMFAFAIHNPGH